MIRSAVWFITFNCNLQCPYCWERQAQKHGELMPTPFINADEWVKAWNRIQPGVLDITGGEPFMQPGFVDMIKRIDANIAITTNATQDMTRFVQEITPDKVFSMTISWHPTGRMSLDEFIGKCLMLKNRGFSITVNFVAYPEQLWMIEHYKNIFTAWGLRFHVDPYSQTKFFPYQLSQVEARFVGKFTGEDRKPVNPRKVTCSAGVDHLTVFPDGTAYPCINNKIENLGSVGNILDNKFAPFRAPILCNMVHKCAGCNRDKVQVFNVE